MTKQTLKINYLNNPCPLCDIIEKKKNEDKSSQSDDNNNIQIQQKMHCCCARALFYHGLFKTKIKEYLKIAHVDGILYNGSSTSLWMCKEYFQNADIYEFEFDREHTNIKQKSSIVDSFSSKNVLFDIIIIHYDTTNNHFEDQIRIIEKTQSFLKPGGMLITESISSSSQEKDYIDTLKNICLDQFQDYYFAEVQHQNMYFEDTNNKKLFFILTKKESPPIFENTNKITIITPCYRINNLKKIKETIPFEYIEKWFIVYDGSKITELPNIFKGEEEKIEEYVHCGKGIVGNSQRNFALSLIENPDAIIYFLDDDNVIHPDFHLLLRVIENDKLYTFHQMNGTKARNGNNIRLNHIDTAMFIIPFRLCKEIKWIEHKYNADGHYIVECYHKNKNAHVFIDNFLCYYNKLK